MEEFKNIKTRGITVEDLLSYGHTIELINELKELDLKDFLEEYANIKKEYALYNYIYSNKSRSKSKKKNK